MDYRSSGVDIDAGNEVVRRIKHLARSTFTPAVLSDIGSFGGLFRLDSGRYREPVLVSSADGVGTKLRVAFMANRHRSVGVDLVNHCVNDILVQGAEPLFFLDYLATGRLSADVAAEVVAGLAEACRTNGCALIGGETAEMPGFYADGEYDLAGFIVGIVERSGIVDGRDLTAGDCLIGLASSGLHTNGYSLARTIIFERLGLRVASYVPDLSATVGDALLAPHRSYLSVVRPLLARGLIKGMAHITGGGITENLPRIPPGALAAEIDLNAWVPPPIFGFLQKAGVVPEEEMLRTFNMGLGLILACGSDQAAEVRELIGATGESGAVIGRVMEGAGRVSYVRT